MDPIIASGLISIGKQIIPKVGNVAANLIQGNSFENKLSSASTTAVNKVEKSNIIPSPEQWAVQKSEAFKSLLNSQQLFSQTSKGNWSSATLQFDDANGMVYLQNSSGERLSILPKSEAGQFAQQLRSFEEKLGNTLPIDQNGNATMILSKFPTPFATSINNVRQAI